MDVCSPSHRAISFDPSPDIKASTIVDEDHREGRCLLSAAKAKPPRNTFLCFHGGFQSKKEWYIIYVKLFFVVDVPVILMLISFEV